MNASGLKRLIPVGWKGSIRALVDRLAERHVFEATESQREDIALRSERFLASFSIEGEDARALKFDLATGPWRTRARAAARLSTESAWTNWNVIGSLSVLDSEEPTGHDDARLASAILVAAHEALVPGVAARHAALQGPARAALAHEKDGVGHWDETAKPLVMEFAKNARANGADRRTAALKALCAAVHLKGQAMRASTAVDPFLVGAAASSLLDEKDERAEDGAPSALEELARAIASLNDARAVLWDDTDDETTRLLGAAAGFAAFGRGVISRPAAHAAGVSSAFTPSAGVLQRYARLTASEAAAALDDEAADPRLDAEDRRRLETLSETLRRHPSAHAVSYAEALGEDMPEACVSELRPGMKVYGAVMDGRRRPVIREGKNGRVVRCRAVAGPDGALVGYLAFDALCREFGGRPLYAAYALDGDRYGYAWADGRPVIRRGTPEQGFMTAPERISV